MNLHGYSSLGSVQGRPVQTVAPSRATAPVESTAKVSRSQEGTGADSQVAQDTVLISDEARRRANGEEKASTNQLNQAKQGDTTAKAPAVDTAAKPEDADEPKQVEKKNDAESETGLTESEEELVQNLEKRDAEVKAHEQAHLTAAGGLAKGGPKYDYQRGPDGKQYAIGGSVEIDVTPEKDPQATIAKAETIKRAALAPAEPSGKDRQVAAKAEALKSDARRQIQEASAEELKATEEDRKGEQDETPLNSLGSDKPIGAGQTSSVGGLGSESSDKPSPFKPLGTAANQSNNSGVNPGFGTQPFSRQENNNSPGLTYSGAGQSNNPGFGSGFSIDDVA